MTINKFQIIENHGPNNLRDYLKAKLPKALGVDIAVAFATKSGVKEILPYLYQVASRGKVRILVGLYQHVTEPEALESLLQVQKQTKDKLSVRLSKESKFHTKLYLLKYASNETVIIGSSNLTKEGLTSGGELNIVLSTPIASASQRRMRQVFEDEWERGVSLRADQIEKYKQARPQIDRKATQLKLSLREILGVDPSHKKAIESQKNERKYWREYIEGYVQAATTQILSQTTDWDKKGYDFMSSTKNSYETGDRILLFDFTIDRLIVAEIKGRTEISTPDGRYFVAFKSIRGIPRKHLTKTLWQKLKSSGLISKKADVYFRRRISEMKWNEFMSLVKGK